jgi:hypothetical protein
MTRSPSFRATDLGNIETIIGGNSEPFSNHKFLLDDMFLFQMTLLCRPSLSTLDHATSWNCCLTDMVSPTCSVPNLDGYIDGIQGQKP